MLLWGLSTLLIFKVTECLAPVLEFLRGAIRLFTRGLHRARQFVARMGEKKNTRHNCKQGVIHWIASSGHVKESALEGAGVMVHLAKQKLQTKVMCQ